LRKVVVIEDKIKLHPGNKNARKLREAFGGVEPVSRKVHDASNGSQEMTADSNNSASEKKTVNSMTTGGEMLESRTLKHWG